MIRQIMEKSGSAEVIFRRIATAFAPLKKRIKRKIKSNRTATQENNSSVAILDFKNTIKLCNIKPGDIVLIHSSIDGLRLLGMEPKDIVELIIECLDGTTILFATFPIEPRTKKTIYVYNPKTSLCWTGILPNVFLQKEGVIRSDIPYNSLSAFGNLSEDIMKNNLMSDTPHGEYSPWYYCYTHHAKILFLGTTSRESNTMAIHMVPDVMKSEWPIDNWYEKRSYIIKGNTDSKNKDLYIQRGFWYQYVNEYKTDRLLKENGLVKDISTRSITIELVPDCFDMLNYLINRCKNGKLMYSIPKKFYLKRN